MQRCSTIYGRSHRIFSEFISHSEELNNSKISTKKEVIDICIDNKYLYIIGKM